MHDMGTMRIRHMYDILNEVSMHPSLPVEVATHEFGLLVFVDVEKG